MCEARDGKHRVKRSFIEKGIDDPKGDSSSESQDKKRPADDDAGSRSKRGLDNPASESGITRRREDDSNGNMLFDMLARERRDSLERAHRSR